MASPSRPSGFSPPPAAGKADTHRPVRGKKPPRASKIAQGEAKKASRARKKAERREFRRFTRATRQRRLSITAGVGAVVMLLILVVVLTTSPVMSLRTIRVEGVERLTSDEIIEQLQPLAGLPLARVSASDVARELSDIPLIQSVDTRVQLPSSLTVTIVERTALGAHRVANGYDIVDRAGVVLWSQTSRPTELPLIDGVVDPEADGFRAITEVLSVIPPEVLARVDQVSATSLDTVGFLLRDSSHQVLWGSSEFSRQKARALPAALQAAGASGAKLIDLSTPETVVIRNLPQSQPTPTRPEP